MHKGLTVSAVVVALLASTAGALPNVQFQDFALGLGNGVTLLGDGSAANTNLLTLGQMQLAADDVRHTTAYQGVNGALMESAAAVGSNGLFGAIQSGTLSGGQYQDSVMDYQSQALEGNLGQEVYRQGGNGSALGIETLVGIGTQLIFTPYGASANIQAIGDVLYDATGGGPGGSTTVGGGAIIGVGQTQM
jgi:hypothetical protein